MPDQFEEVSLILRGDTYTLECRDNTGTLSAIRLSVASLLYLLPLIQRECAQMRESLSTPGLKSQGVEPIVAIPVRGFDVGSDLHQSEISLTLQDKDGNRYIFCFSPPDGAARVGQRLIERADELARATPQTKQ